MLTVRQITLLWFPLASMWILMSVEGPIVQAVAARLPEPALNLAAYGYAFFSMLLLEAPVFMFLSASNALVKGPLSFTRFRNYSYFVSFLFSFLCFAIAISGLFYQISLHIVGLSPELSRLSESCFLWLSVCPLMVGYRRFYQGILIRSRQSRWIAWGGIFRVFVGTGVALALYACSKLPGGVIACAALSLAIIFEAYFIRWRSLAVVKRLLADPLPGDRNLSLSEMNRFYLPLALSSVVNTGVQPVLTFFLARAHDAKLALAAWPVLMSFLFLLASSAIAYQDLVIAHHHEDTAEPSALVRFGRGMTGCLALIGLVLLLPPVFDFWFERMVGLTAALTHYLYPAAAFSIPFAILAVLGSWLRALHTLNHTTRQVSIEAAIELGVSFLLMWLLVAAELFPGAVTAVLSLIVARALGALYLWQSHYGPLKQRASLLTS